MPSPYRPSFWEELRRRRVVRAVMVYAVGAWVVVQVADVFVPALLLPEWTLTLVAILAVLGFPATVAVAWLFEWTPKGLRRDAAESTAGGESEPGGLPPASLLDRRLATALLLGVVLGVVVVGIGSWAVRVAVGRAPETVAGADRTAADVLAVLPFETVGEANPTFTEGMHGDVLTRLASVNGLDVIARSSVLQYPTPGATARKVRDDLGADWLLRGEVQQVGPRVRVHARLVDTRSERQVWAEAYEGELTAEGLFDIQREITRQIVGALEARIAGDPPAGASPASTTGDLDAYRLQVEGRALLGPRTELSLRRAVRHFEEAILRDSTYALAWAGLADALTYLVTFGYELPDAYTDPMGPAVRALELDPDLPEAHFALANLAHAREDNPEAVRRLERVVQIRPSHADAHNLLSWIHKLDGRPEAALRSAERATQLDPLGSAPRSNLALALLVTGRPERALEETALIRDLHPDFSTGAFLEALAHHALGHPREAAGLLTELEVPWAGEAPKALEALAAVAVHDSLSARRLRAGMDPTSDPFSAALVDVALGEVEAAWTRLVELKHWGYWPTFALRYLFPEVLRPIRSHPGYPALLERVSRSWGRGSARPGR